VVDGRATVIDVVLPPAFEQSVQSGPVSLGTELTLRWYSGRIQDSAVNVTYRWDGSHFVLG
jgi:hypothetical protein